MLAAMALEKHPRAAAAINAAREFLEKFERASFEIAARKAYNFARVFESWSDDRDAQSVCADAFVRASMTQRTDPRFARVKFKTASGRGSR